MDWSLEQDKSSLQLLHYGLDPGPPRPHHRTPTSCLFLLHHGLRAGCRFYVNVDSDIYLVVRFSWSQEG